MDLPSGTSIAQVHLQTSNLPDLRQFYSGLLGFQEIEQEGQSLYLSATGRFPAQLIITENKEAIPLDRRSPGLFHTAFLLPGRIELGLILKRLIEHNIRLGFGDHGVSEAIYLSDPEGNGVELYSDRPRDAWPIINGQIEMTTGPVNTQALLQEARKQPGDWQGIAPQTVIGHVHLQVSSISRAEEFYHDLLGFDVTQRSYPGALFVSAGGYHHHLGLNIWNSRNASPAAENSTGLYSFTINIPDSAYIPYLEKRFSEAGIQVDYSGTGELTCHDLDSIRVKITTSTDTQVSS